MARKGRNEEIENIENEVWSFSSSFSSRRGRFAEEEKTFISVKFSVSFFSHTYRRHWLSFASRHTPERNWATGVSESRNEEEKRDWEDIQPHTKFEQIVWGRRRKEFRLTPTRFHYWFVDVPGSGQSSEEQKKDDSWPEKKLDKTTSRIHSSWMKKLKKFNSNYFKFNAIYFSTWKTEEEAINQVGRSECSFPLWLGQVDQVNRISIFLSAQYPTSFCDVSDPNPSLFSFSGKVFKQTEDSFTLIRFHRVSMREIFTQPSKLLC